eukprot:13970666-Ditylum_brightwellii.AAC.1
MENLGIKAIPEPHLLIKDHKKKKNGHHPTRLVIPMTKFAATFSKIGCLGIKKIFDEEGVNYSIYTIQQASDIKAKLEMLDLKQGEQVFQYYAQNLFTRKQAIIKQCMEMIAFGMKTTL